MTRTIDLNPLVQMKSDRALQEALLGECDRVVRAILVVQGRSESHLAPPPASESDPISRRKMLIERKFGGSPSSMMEQLTALGLRPRGGKLGDAVVVEGTAPQLIQALEMPEIIRGILDQNVHLIQPPQRASAADGNESSGE